MNRKHAALAVAAAAVLSAPVFAQSTFCDASASSCTTTTILGAGPVMSSNGAVINSGTGLIVGEGAPSTSVTVLPSSAVAVSTVPGNRLLPGAAQLQASQTTVLGGPAAGGVSGSQTIVTNYWVNVPANAERRSDFQRWQSLR